MFNVIATNRKTMSVNSWMKIAPSTKYDDKRPGRLKLEETTDVSPWSFIKLNKRQKIIIATVIITIGLLLIGTINLIYISYKYIIVLGVLAYFLSLWALWEGISKLKAVVLLILPTMFTMAVASFYLLLPVRWLTRLPISIIFGLSFYSLLLSQNVFNVASERTIPLFRAASTVSFLFALITAFFLFNVVSGFDLPFYLNGIVCAMVAFPLVLQTLWSVQMEKLTSPTIIYSFIASLIVGETAIALSFWPVAPTVWSLTLSTMIYVLVSIISEFMKEKINSRLVLECLGIGVMVLLFSFLATSWAG